MALVSKHVMQAIGTVILIAKRESAGEKPDDQAQAAYGKAVDSLAHLSAREQMDAFSHWYLTGQQTFEYRDRRQVDGLTHDQEQEQVQRGNVQEARDHRILRSSSGNRAPLIPATFDSAATTARASVTATPAMKPPEDLQSDSKAHQTAKRLAHHPSVSSNAEGRDS